MSVGYRPSVDGLAIEYRPTCKPVEKRPISANISAECRSRYRSSVGQHVGRQMPLVHKKLVFPAGGCAQHCCTDGSAKRTQHKTKVTLNGVGSKF